jgi:glucose-1-phosphate thymidylyltransferase
VRVIEERQGIKVGCPEEAAWRNGWLTNDEVVASGERLFKSGYGKYLLNLIGL